MYFIQTVSSFVLISPMSSRIGALRTFPQLRVPIHFVNKYAFRSVASLSGHRRPLLLPKSDLTGLNRRGFKNFDYENRHVPGWEKSGIYFVLAIALYLLINPVQYARLMKLRQELRKRRLEEFQGVELSEEERQESDLKVKELIDSLY